MGEFSVFAIDQRMECPWRPVSQPLRFGPKPARIQLRKRRRRSGEPLRDHGGYGNRRLNRRALVRLRGRGFQAYSRPGEH